MMDDWPAMPQNVDRYVIYKGMCKTCAEQNREVQVCDWVECPTGGWWSHRRHPSDDHEANIGWQPEEGMSDDGHYFTVGAWTPGGIT